jgi:hypothetical protein
MKKYKVVKDEGYPFPCLDCVFELAHDCQRLVKENNLPNCYNNLCHFEEIEEGTITTKDLTDIDKANDEKTK